MALYKINFTLNGERLFTTGESSYPTKEDLASGNYSQDIALTNAMIFIAGYKEIKGIEGDVNPQTVAFIIEQN